MFINPDKNANPEILELAIKLEAIAEWMEDTSSSNPNTAHMLMKSSEWLRKLANKTCGADFIGCNGGPECDYEHK